jgi:hypothetical protein
LEFLNKQHLAAKVQEGSQSQKNELVTRLTDMIKLKWPDEAMTGYLDHNRVFAMAEMFVGRANTLQDIVNELQLFFDEPDWSSQEAQDMLSFIGPREYGECAYLLDLCDSADILTEA